MHRAHDYARAVVDGEVTTGEYVRLACARHLADLEHADERGLWFVDKLASKACAFFPKFLRHSKGRHARTPFELEPWQEFIVGSVFGWVREDGTRRFRTVYGEVGRKNGKSTLLSGIGLLGLTADGEAGAEIYTAGTKMAQAKIIHSEAIRMVKQSPDLTKDLEVLRENISYEKTFSKYEPLGADATTLDGLNVHFALIDELHAHKTRALFDVLEGGMGAREQPLLFTITTAGFDRFSVCYQERADAVRVLEGVVEDDSTFAYIATLDPGDEWDDPEVWQKANPNLGVSCTLEYLSTRCEKAQRTPSRQNVFKRVNCNQWTQKETRFLNLTDWDACAGDQMPHEIEKQCEGAIAFGGLDLASVSDLTAFVLVVPDGDGFQVIPRFWIPGHDLEERVKTTRTPYDEWAREGWLTLTPGNVTDYRTVIEEIEQLGERYLIRDICFDRWGAQKISNELVDAGFELTQFGQGFASMTAPTRELERQVLSGGLRHGGHPVLRWNADNLEVVTDPAENVKPVKPDHRMSHLKIDGMVALIMGLGSSLAYRDTEPPPSVYATRGAVIM